MKVVLDEQAAPAPAAEPAPAPAQKKIPEVKPAEGGDLRGKVQEKEGAQVAAPTAPVPTAPEPAPGKISKVEEPLKTWDTSDAAAPQADTALNSWFAAREGRHGLLLDLLNYIQRNASDRLSPLTMALLNRITELSPNTTVEMIGLDAALKRWPALEGKLNEFTGGIHMREFDHVLLFEHSWNQTRNAVHEAVHAVSSRVIDVDPKLRSDLTRLLEEARKAGEPLNPYGLKNVDEFLAEAYSNPGFQDWLRTARPVPGKLTLWQRFVKWVRNVLGMAPKDETLLDEVLRVSKGKLRAEQISPEVAAEFRRRWTGQQPLKVSAVQESLIALTPEDLANLRKNEANIPPEERQRTYRLVRVQSMVSDIIRAAFNALPDSVRNEIEGLLNMTDQFRVSDSAKALSENPNPSMRLADQLTGNPNEDGTLVYGYYARVMKMQAAHDQLANQIRQREGELAKKLKVHSPARIESDIEEAMLDSGRNIVGDYQNKLLGQIQRGVNVEAARKRLAMTEDLASNFAFQRVLDELSNKPAGPTPVATDPMLQGGIKAAPGKPGVTPQMMAQIREVISNSPGVDRYISDVRRAKSWRGAGNPIDLDPELQTKRAALAYLESEFQKPEFRENHELAVNMSGIRMGDIVYRDDIPTRPTIFKNPLTGKTRTVEMGFTAAEEKKTREGFMEIISDMEASLDDPALDPATANLYREVIQEFKTQQFHQAFNPEIGKWTAGMGNLAALFSNGHFAPGWLSNFEYLTNLVGGRPAGEMQRALSRFNQLHQMTDVAWKDTVDRANTDSWNAAKARGMTYEEWERKISDPIWNSYQSPVGMERKKLGSRLDGGYVVTEADWKAIMSQKRFMDNLHKSVLEVSRSTSAGRGSSVLVEDRLSGKKVFRPFIQQDMISPRHYRDEAFGVNGYAWNWQEARKRFGEDTAGFVQGMARMFGSGDPFRTVFMSHIKSMVRNPTYLSKDSPMMPQYKTVTALAELGTEPKTMPELVDRLFAEGAKDKDGNRMTKDQIQYQLISEVSQYMNRVFDYRSKVREFYENPKTVKILDPDSHYTMARGDQIAPDEFYTYSVGDRNAQARLLSETERVFLHWVRQATVDMVASLEREKKKYTDQVEAVKAELAKTMPSATAEKKAVKQVEARSQQLRKAGETSLAMSEIQGHIDNARWIIAKLESEDALSMRPEFAAFSSGFRSTIGVPLLNSPPVAIRNLGGGMARLAQTDQMLHATQSVPVAWPLWGIPISMAKSAYFTGKGFVKMVEGWATTRFANTEYGQSLLKSLKDHPDFWNSWAGGLIQQITQNLEDYTATRKLGINIMGGPFTDRMKALWELRSMGGSIRKEQASGMRQLAERIRSLSELATQTGVTGLAPRSFFQMLADFIVNWGAITQADHLAWFLERNAVKRLVKTGLIDSISDYDRLPHQMLTGRGTMESQATWLRREIMLKAGIDIDQAMITYARAIKDAITNGRDTSDIRMLDDAQRHGLWQVWAAKNNKPLFGNRPFLIAQNPEGRIFGMFQGYGSWYNTEFATGWGKFTKDTDPVNIRGHTRAAAMLSTAILAMLGFAVPVIHALMPVLFKKEYVNPDPKDAENAWEFTRALLINGSPAFPMIGLLGNQLLEQYKPGAGVANYGFNLLPLNVLNAFQRMMRDGIATGDFTRPVLQFVRQFQPNTQIVINRLPIMAGTTERANLRKELQAATPTSIELRVTGTGGAYKLSPVSDNVNAIINALYQPGGPDMGEAMNQRQIAINYKMQNEGKDDVQAGREVDSSVMSKTPWMDVYGRVLTEQERMSIEARMSDTAKQRLGMAEQAFSAYASAVGRPEPRFVQMERGQMGGGGGGGGRIMGAVPAVRMGLPAGPGMRTRGMMPSISTGIGGFRLSRAGLRLPRVSVRMGGIRRRTGGRIRRAGGARRLRRIRTPKLARL